MSAMEDEYAAELEAEETYEALLVGVGPQGPPGPAGPAGSEGGEHLHTSAQVSDFVEAVQDAVAQLLGAGSNITLNYDDAGNTLTVAATDGSSFDPEAVRDAMGVALVGVGPISIAVNDAADTITISTTATANATDAALRDRATHTGSQPISTVAGLQAALDGKQASLPAPVDGKFLSVAGGTYALVDAPSGGGGVGRLGTPESQRWYSLNSGSINATGQSAEITLWPMDISAAMPLQSLGFETYSSAATTVNVAFYVLTTGMTFDRVTAVASQAVTGSARYTVPITGTLPKGTVWMAFSAGASWMVQSLYQTSYPGPIPLASTTTFPFTAPNAVRTSGASGTMPQTVVATTTVRIDQPVVNVRVA